MRQLRNKKTGEIYEPASKDAIDVYFYAQVGDGKALTKRSYDSISKLNEEWEDHVPKEPLIKDEKVRKAVKAWADANDIGQKHYHDNNVKFDFLEHRFKWIETSIEFNDIKGLEYLKDGWEYTIAELCGEEDE